MLLVHPTCVQTTSISICWKLPRDALMLAFSVIQHFAALSTLDWLCSCFYSNCCVNMRQSLVFSHLKKIAIDRMVSWGVVAKKVFRFQALREYNTKYAFDPEGGQKGGVESIEEAERNGAVLPGRWICLQHVSKWLPWTWRKTMR